MRQVLCRPGLRKILKDKYAIAEDFPESHDIPPNAEQVDQNGHLRLGSESKSLQVTEIRVSFHGQIIKNDVPTLRSKRRVEAFRAKSRQQDDPSFRYGPFPGPQQRDQGFPARPKPGTFGQRFRAGSAGYLNNPMVIDQVHGLKLVEKQTYPEVMRIYT